MAFPMYEEMMRDGYEIADCNQWYRELQQAFINSQWENTTSLLTSVQEQKINLSHDDYYDTFDFDTIEAWVNTVVGQSSTGSKTGRDFLQLIFKDITHPKFEGRYYIVDNEYYISYFDNRVVDVDANLSVRRCNEWMRIVDPLDGKIYSIPCVVDYDMTAAAFKISTPIITPNNHATVKVQQNATTDRLFVTNSRFILGNRPFKITGMQNATNQFINNNVSSLMEIDLFLDEIWEKDDIPNGIADNGIYNYNIHIIDDTNNSLEVVPNGHGQLYTEITLNNETVNREVVWESSNNNIITIDNNGYYNVIGNVGDFAIITASLFSNQDNYDSITLTIVDVMDNQPVIVFNPIINAIREYDKLTTIVSVFADGSLIVPTEINITFDNEDINSYLFVEQNNNIITFNCLRRKSLPVIAHFVVKTDNPVLELETDIEIKLTSLLG